MSSRQRRYTRRTVSRRKTSVREPSISNKSRAANRYFAAKAAMSFIGFPIGNAVRETADYRRGQEAIVRYQDQGFKIVPLEYSFSGMVPLQKHWRKLENVVHSGADQPRRTSRLSLAKSAVLHSGGDVTFKRTLTIEVLFIQAMDFIELSNADLTVFKDETRIKVKNAPNVAVAHVDTTTTAVVIRLNMTVAPLAVAMLTLSFSGGTISFAQDPTGKFYLMNTLVKTRYDKIPDEYMEGSRVHLPCFDDYRLRTPFFVTLGRPAGAVSISNAPLIATTKLTGDKSRTDWSWDTFALTAPVTIDQLGFLISNNLKIFTPMVQGTFARFITEKGQDSTYFEEKVMPYVPEVSKQLELTLQSLYDPMPTNLVVASGTDLGSLIPNFGYNKLGLIFAKPFDFGTDGLKASKDPSSEVYKSLTSLARWNSQLWFEIGLSGDSQLVEWLHRCMSTLVTRAVVDGIIPNPERALILEVSMGEIGLLLDDRMPCEVCVWNPDFSWKYDFELARGVAVLTTMKHVFGDSTFWKGVMQYMVLYWGHVILSGSRFLRSLDEIIRADKDKEALLPKDLKSVVSLYKEYFASLDRYVPVVSVTRNLLMKTVTFSQEAIQARDVIHGGSKCSGQAMQLPVKKDKSWGIPITINSGRKPKWAQTKPLAWLKPSQTTTQAYPCPAESDDFVIVNAGRSAAYCRVNYDDDNWLKITKVIETGGGMPEKVRAVIYGDALYLYRHKKIKADHAKLLAKNCVQERSDVCRIVAALNWDTIVDLAPKAAAEEENNIKKVVKKFKSEFDHWFGHRMLSDACLRKFGA